LARDGNSFIVCYVAGNQKKCQASTGVYYEWIEHRRSVETGVCSVGRHGDWELVSYRVEEVPAEKSTLVHTLYFDSGNTDNRCGVNSGFHLDF